MDDISDILGTQIKARAGVSHQTNMILPVDVVEDLQDKADHGDLVTCGTETKFRVVVNQVKYDPVEQPEHAHATITLHATAQ